MYKTILWTIAFICSMAFSPLTFADDDYCGEGLGEMVQSLDLEDAQKEKIKPILEQLKTTIHNTGSQMKDLDTQLNNTDLAVMSEDKVNEVVDNKTKLIGDMMKAKMRAKNQIYSILTTEQKAKFQEKVKKMDDKMADLYKKCHDDD